MVHYDQVFQKRYDVIIQFNIDIILSAFEEKYISFHLMNDSKVADQLCFAATLLKFR